MYNRILKFLNLYIIISIFPINRDLFEKIHIFDHDVVKLVIILLGITSIIDIILTNNIKKFFEFKRVILYPLLLLIISSFNSIDKLQSITLAIELICMCIYVINIIIKNVDGKINIISNINFSFFIFLIINYLYIFLYPEQTQYIDFRYGITLQGITGHRIHLAICCALIISVSYINLTNANKKFSKIISIFNIIIGIYFMYNSKSETANIALLIVVFIAIINKILYIRGTVLIFILNIASIVYMSIISIIEKLSYWLHLNLNLTLTGRTGIWKGIIEMIKIREIGYGLGTFWGTNQYSDYYSLNYFNGGHAHNGMFEMILELGVIGTIIISICLWQNIKKLREKELYKFIYIKFSYIVLALIFFISFSEPVLFSYQYVNIFNYMLLISFSFITAQKKIIEKNNKEINW